MLINGHRNLRREGAGGEELAARHLIANGYRIVERNFRYRRSGEIDIIARDGEDLVFCEVKMRRSGAWGPPEYAVSLRKQETIRRVAAAYLYLRHCAECPCRFDVVTITYDGNEPVVDLIRNAF